MPEEKTSNPNYEVSHLSWSAYEYEHQEKHSDWYWLMGIIAGLAILLCLLIKNFLLAIILIIASFSLYRLSKRPPELVDVVLSSDGIRIGREIYFFRHLKSFSAKTKVPQQKLIIETDRFYLPHVNVPVGDVDLEDARRYLKKFLMEKPFEESLSEKIFEFFGF